MKRVPVDSTSLDSIGYDAVSMILEIEFISGKVYRYFDVPQSVHAEMMDADSKGQFFNTRIRNNFRYVELS
jgi:KTSC domain